MKPNRSFLNRALTVVLGACLFTGSASAQVARGKFTLAHETKWAGAVLPAGDYQFRMNSLRMPELISIETQDRQGVAMVLVGVHSQVKFSDDNALIVLVNGNQRTVRMLKLGCGEAYSYQLPKGVKLRQMAEGRGLLQRIPIAVSVKSAR
jgi:hypothetical protein